MNTTTLDLEEDYDVGRRRSPIDLVTKDQLGTVHNIWTSWPTLNKWMDDGLFPPAYSLSPNRMVWRLVDIERFKSTRPLRGEPLPHLWPPRKRQRVEAPPGSKPRGRPTGSKIVVDADGRRRLVMPETEPRVRRRQT